MKKLFKRFALIAITFVAVFGIFAPRSFAANGEYSKPECDGFFQNLTCTSLDHIASFMTMAYESFVDQFLEISPATFDYEYAGSPGYALHTAWTKCCSRAVNPDFSFKRSRSAFWLSLSSSLRIDRRCSCPSSVCRADSSSFSRAERSSRHFSSSSSSFAAFSESRAVSESRKAVLLS